MEARAWSLKYVNQIRALQWESFCHPRTEAILPWVYEFYANARDSNGEKVFVRGKSVDFSAKIINDLFDLDNNIQDGYANILTSVSLDEMMAMVCCTPEPEWASQSRKTLRATCLNREAKGMAPIHQRRGYADTTSEYIDITEGRSYL
ncbi:hypothetical protein KSP40_PGU015019 [Platanthera guangdongensis]|uniref:Putative plant transposon protein domain-containing protein n=1 Tax=Platanthera guangdongensis TaxID=2320717 RepID=A0ABR2M4I1_9ASPA